jgi:hypothetical protein
MVIKWRRFYGWIFISLPVIEMCNLYRVLIRNYLEKIQHKNPMRYVGDNIKLNFKEVSFECFVWIKLARNRVNSCFFFFEDCDRPFSFIHDL